MKNIIQLTRTTREQKFDVSLGKGVIISLNEASIKMIKILIYLYQKDSSLLAGDISGLKKRYKEIRYRESVQNLLLKHNKLKIKI